MAVDNCQKVKLLVIYELLRQDSNEDHPMRAADIISRLNEKGISCDRRTLSRDMKTLNDHGYEIMSVFSGHDKLYYVEDRSFSEPEIRILLDAVRAAGFITEKKTAELMDKIAGLGGSHRAKLLTEERMSFNTRKHTNESVYYSVDCLEEAIRNGRKATFRYFDLDENASRVYRRAGDRYTVEPIELVCSEDNYYLVTYSPKYEDTANYRIDRMDSVKVSEESISPESVKAKEELGDVTARMVKMFSGKTETVTLRFLDTLLDPVYDRFGESLPVKRLNDEVCELTADVAVSDTFYGWLFQFAGRMQLMEPDRLRREYEKRAEKVMKRGNTGG